MRSKILVVPGNTDLNRGDQALVWESIHVLEDVITDLEVYLYNSGADIVEQNAQKSQTKLFGYTFLSRILQHPRASTGRKTNEIHYSIFTYLLWTVKGLADFFTSYLLLVKSTSLNKIGRFFLSENQKRTLDIFMQLDILVVKGGGFLHSYGKFSDPYLMYFFLFDLLLAKRFGIKVIILPNSIGPLKNRFARFLVKKALTKCDFISTRESVSSEFLRENLLVNNFLFPDLGFYLKASEIDIKDALKKYGVDFSKKRVAVTLRPYRFDDKANSKELYNNYISEMADVIRHLAAEKYQVSLITHTLGPSAHENDQLAIDEVLKTLGNIPNVISFSNSDWNCEQLQKIYSYYDLLIGTRFHSVIFALNMYIPCIAIAYGGNKSYGIMEDIGVSEYVVGIEKIKCQIVMDLVYSAFKHSTLYVQKISDYKDFLAEKRNEMLAEIQAVL